MPKIFSLSFLWVVLCFSCAAQKKKASIPSNSAFYSGTIEGYKASNDSVRIVLHRNYTSHLTNSYEDIYAPIDRKGNFKFTISSLSQPGKISFYIVGEATERLGDFIVAPGDDIKLSVKLSNNNAVLVFSGRGMEKYLARQKIELAKEEFNKKRDEATELRWYNEKKVELLFKLHQSGYASILFELDQYKNRLNPEIYNFMKGEFTSYPLGVWYMTLQIFLEGDNSAANKEKLLKYFTLSKVDDDAIALNNLARSRNFIGYIIDKEKARILLSRNEKKIDFKKMYDHLRSSYSGILREHLLASYLLETTTQNGLSFSDPFDFEVCLQDAYSIIKTPSMKEEVNRYIRLYSRGYNVYNFSLPDTMGTPRSLTDFKGKVVMLDLWATGCTGCAIFARYFKENIYPAFKEDSNFVVVSINTDSKREQWMKSLYSGKYTQPHHVNLNISDEQKDPILNYYNIGARGLPLLILVDKQGKVYAPLTIHSMGKLKWLIRDALDEK